MEVKRVSPKVKDKTPKDLLNEKFKGKTFAQLSIKEKDELLEQVLIDLGYLKGGS
jgi:hypothetical protein